MFSYLKKPEIPEKMTALAESARYDVCLATCAGGSGGKAGRSRNPLNPLEEWIYPAAVPGKGWVHILKILQSNSCRNNCSYCRFSAGNSGIERTAMSPGELARAFMDLVRSRLVEGIFISSGVCGNPTSSMENMVRTAELLRNHYHFGGYIHLKIIPGCAEHLIDAAASFANRLSINLEAPSSARLGLIAPEKDLENEILPAVNHTAGLLRRKAENNTPGIRAVSQTTQFVVGAAGESDQEIMTAVDRLYRDMYMFRSYFSAYQKTAGTAENPRSRRREAFAGSPLLREHRLYQCDFLLRSYGFRFPDLVFDSRGNIPLETDPKTAWAVLNPESFPVEINKASEDELLRVPGIGPASAARIIETRKENPFRTLEDLKETGAWSRRAAGWIELGGRHPSWDDADGYNPGQRWLFEELAPDGWKTAAAGSGGTDCGYDYPAQKGKWVNYQFRKSDKRIWCR